jgi:hypothetical protein
MYMLFQLMGQQAQQFAKVMILAYPTIGQLLGSGLLQQL